MVAFWAAPGQCQHALSARALRERSGNDDDNGLEEHHVVRWQRV